MAKTSGWKMVGCLLAIGALFVIAIGVGHLLEGR